MKRHGGFEHNRQSLRVVELLEQKYPRFPGLNLTWEVREGLVKHHTSFDRPRRLKGFDARCSCLEAQVANLADEITYYSHDLDDGLTARLFTEDQLNRDVEVWREAWAEVKRAYGKLPDESRRYFIIRCIIDCEVKDVVHTTERRIRQAGVVSADEVRRQPKPLAQYSPRLRQLNLQLKNYLYQNLYFNPEVHEPNRRAVHMLAELFQFYVDHHGEVGELSRQRARKDGWHRAICDYLAGMTDRYAIQEFQRLFGLSV